MDEAQERIELNLSNEMDLDKANIYNQLAQNLTPYREKPYFSVEFIVEGTKEHPVVGIRYPGRKLVNRVNVGRILKLRNNSVEWANLLDFLVIPYDDGRPREEQEFTFEGILRDFQDNKRDSEEFWELIVKLYYNNEVGSNIPTLPGLDPLLYLKVLKWIWIQEDLNYKFSSKDINSPVKYVLETRTGNRTSKGAGRGKFFAALILLRKDYFSFEEVKKIINLN